METKKQEAIRKAWGKYWEEVKDNVIGMGTHGGWADNEIVHYNEDLGCDSKGFEFENNLYRPKSLAGIENNNGWIAIESEEDLPKKLGKYKVVLKDRVPFTWIFETFCDIESSGELWMSRYSHYKKVEEELPPIY